MSVDLKTDMFSDEMVSDDVFRQMLAALEEAVRKHIGDPTFKLHKD
jgi:hypothetical protein